MEATHTLMWVSTVFTERFLFPNATVEEKCVKAGKLLKTEARSALERFAGINVSVRRVPPPRPPREITPLIDTAMHVDAA